MRELPREDAEEEAHRIAATPVSLEAQRVAVAAPGLVPLRVP